MGLEYVVHKSITSPFMLAYETCFFCALPFRWGRPATPDEKAEGERDLTWQGGSCWTRPHWGGLPCEPVEQRSKKRDNKSEEESPQV